MSKRYGDDVVLENVNVEVDAGEFVTIVGASGAGKTTFLKLLLGTEVATEGDILLDGVAIPAEPGPDRGIVFQRYSVFPHLDVLGNVMLGAEFAGAALLGRLFGPARRAARDEAVALLEEVGLEAALHRYPHELSGGMQQRLALAQALRGRPRILLLDEPFGALDPGIRLDMHALVRRLWREHELTVFMITHDIHEGFALGTRLWAFDRVTDALGQASGGARITYDLPLHGGDTPTESP